MSKILNIGCTRIKRVHHHSFVRIYITEISISEVKDFHFSRREEERGSLNSRKS